MNIQAYEGYELEKALPSTSEDFFNRSVVSYEVNGVKKELMITYLRYFEENLLQGSDVLMSLEKESLTFKDIFALSCLLTDDKLLKQRKLYIADEEEFKRYVKGINVDELKKYFSSFRTEEG